MRTSSICSASVCERKEATCGQSHTCRKIQMASGNECCDSSDEPMPRKVSRPFGQQARAGRSFLTGQTSLVEVRRNTPARSPGSRYSTLG